MSRPSTSPRTDTAADRAFALFCRTGDADALAEVFDRTAPRLALLAGHLVPGDAQAVEDLVQTTFVEAMQAAPRFEPGRPVMPWLVTILGRRAANLRRDARRRPAGDVPEREDGAPDPAALVADRELAERVADTIERLGTPYREAITLRLVHGLTPAEIARALDRPLGTVHAQLHRGTERLRRMLPPATALALAGLLSARDGLAALRARVLDAARDIAMPAPLAAGTGGIIGGLLMTKKLAMIVAVLVVGAVIVWGSRTTPVEPALTPLDDLPATARTAQVSPGIDTDGAGAVLEPALRREPAMPSDSDAITFVGRVVTDEARAPLPGATVEARFYGRVGVHSVPLSLATPRVTTTDTDGRYRLELPPNGDLGIAITVRAPGRATMSADWGEALRPGAVVDNGDVPMALGVELSLSVRDEHGEPVEAFEIQLRRPANRPSSADGAFSPLGWGGIQRTDARGIAGPRSVIVGAWEVQYAEGTGHRYAGPDAIHVPADRTEWLVDLRVEEPPRPEWTVSGVLVDEAGTPLVGVEVWANQDDRNGYRVEQSFGGGRFHLSGFPPEEGPVTFRGIGRAMVEYELVEPVRTVDPGTRDVRLVVRRRPRLDPAFRIVAGRDSEPVERFRFRALAVRHGEDETRLGDWVSGSLILGSSRKHAGGVIRIEELLPIDHLLVVVPEDPALQPVLFREFRPDAESIESVEVRLEPAVTWTVRVVDPDGDPVAGNSVEFLRGVGRTRAGGRHTYTQSMRGAFERGVSATYMAIATSESTTDESGTATLRTASEVDGCALRVLGRAHVEAFVELTGAVTAGDVRTIEVEPAARVVGRLEPIELVRVLGPSPAGRSAAAIYMDPEAQLADARIELELEAVEGRHRATVHVGDNGRFAFDAVPPGDYVLRADFPGVSGDARLAEVGALRAGEARELVIDLRPHRSATIRGVVRLDDAPPPVGSKVVLGRLYVGLDADGRFERRVLPGQFTCGLSVRDSVGGGSSVRYEHERPLAVGPGETLDVALEFVRRRIDLRVVAGDGTPIASKWIQLHKIGDVGESAGFAGLRILDEDGCTTLEGSFVEPLRAVLWLDPPPRGQVRDDPPGRHFELGRIAVPIGEREAFFKFTIDLDALGR